MKRYISPSRLLCHTDYKREMSWSMVRWALVHSTEASNQISVCYAMNELDINVTK